jgi:hypothetical protein
MLVGFTILGVGAGVSQSTFYARGVTNEDRFRMLRKLPLTLALPGHISTQRS